MTKIVVVPLEPRRFGVEVTEGTVTTAHKVMLPEGLLDDLGLGEADPVSVVHESFAFLLDREPASSIQHDFPLDRIAQYFPEFYDELRARLGA